MQLINGSDYKPSSDGTLVYLNGGNDLQKIADKIEVNGGKIIIPKTEIGPEMGFFANLHRLRRKQVGTTFRSLKFYGTVQTIVS